MKKVKLVSMLIAVTALAACGKSVEGPQTDDISELLEMELPEGIDVDDIEIQAAQNEGDEIEPEYRTRSKLTLELVEDWAQAHGSVGDRPIVKVTREAGTEFPAILFTRATPIGDDDWDVEVERLDMKGLKGAPLSSYDDYIIAGSEEEAEAKKELVAREKEEEREREAELEKARSAFAGTWKATRPLTNYGSVFSRNGKQVGVSFDLKPGQDGFGRGTGRVYDFNNPGIYAETDVTYVVRDDGKSAVVTFLDRARNDDVPFWTRQSTNWVLQSDGSAQIEGGSWKIKTAK